MRIARTAVASYPSGAGVACEGATQGECTAAKAPKRVSSRDINACRHYSPRLPNLGASPQMRGIRPMPPTLWGIGKLQERGF